MSPPRVTPTQDARYTQTEIKSRLARPIQQKTGVDKFEPEGDEDLAALRSITSGVSTTFRWIRDSITGGKAPKVFEDQNKSFAEQAKTFLDEGGDVDFKLPSTHPKYPNLSIAEAVKKEAFELKDHSLMAAILKRKYANPAIKFVTKQNHEGMSYTGGWLNGKPHGEGMRTDPTNNSTYLGNWLEGKFHGQGTAIYANGAKYVGQWKADKWDGQGTFIYVDGAQYVGQWKADKRDGQGTMIYADRAQYVGQWKADKRDGQGTIIYADGHKYVGQWQADKQDGQGTAIYADGAQYVGQWKADEWDGQGTFTYTEGTNVQGEFINGRPIGTRDHLGDLKFMGLLTGSLSFSYSSYNLGIMADFLDDQKDPSARALKAALAINTSSEPKPELAKKIMTNLQQHREQLLAYGFKGHSMGLRIKVQDDGSYHFDLYNSGDGLEKYHPRTTVSSGKTLFQTMLRVKVPKNQLTPELLEKILDKDQFKDAAEAYNAIFKIPGAVKVTPASFEAVWQSKQKSHNCSLEWIFVYLRNTKGLHDYTRMRRKLYEATLEASKNPIIDDPNRIIKLQWPSGFNGPTTNLHIEQAYQKVREELKRKLHKPHPVVDPDQYLISKVFRAYFPPDQTGSSTARVLAIRQAETYASDTDIERRRGALTILRGLVDKGEALQEGAAVGKQLAGDSNRGIRRGAVRLLREVAAQSGGIA